MADATVAAIMVVKDEEDIVGVTVEHLLLEVDHVYVLDNLSTDGTPGILNELARRYEGRLTLDVDREVGYYQARKMTALADRARLDGHAWVVPCDADEVWYSAFGRLGQIVVDHHHDGYDIITAEMFDHIATDDDVADEDPTVRIACRRQDRGAMPKVCARLVEGLEIQMGNHAVVFPSPDPVVRTEGLTIRHFPYRSLDQFERKVVNGGRAYAASDLPEEFGAHWRGYYRAWQAGGREATDEIFRAWFHQHDTREGFSDTGLRLIYDPAPVSRPVAAAR